MLRAYHMHLSLIQSAGLFAIVMIGTFLPGTPGNVGSWQFFCTIGLQLFGIGAARAAGFSIVAYFIWTIPPLLIGVVVLATSPFSWSGLRRNQPEPSHADGRRLRDRQAREEGGDWRRRIMMLAKRSPTPSLAAGRVFLRSAALAALLASLLVLVVTGCGGGPGTSGSSTTIQPGGPVLTATTGVPSTSATTAGGTSSTAGSTSTVPGGASSTSSGSPSSTQPAGAQAGGDWPTYDHDAARSGMSSDQEALGSVRRVWTSAGFDGALYAQPLIVGDRVFVASEGNYRVRTRRRDGRDRSGSGTWEKPVPASELPCGNIDPSGITGTPVVAVGTATLFVVANLRSGPHHELFALDLSTGAVRWHRPIDPPGLAPAVEQQRGALALSGGRVYVPFGGLYGDCGQYKGAVVSVAADGSGGLSQLRGSHQPDGGHLESCGAGRRCRW